MDYYPKMSRDSKFRQAFADHFDFRNKPWVAFAKATYRISEKLGVDIEQAVEYLNSDAGGLFALEMVEFAEPGKVKQDIEYLADGAIATLQAMPKAPKAWRKLAGK